MEFKDYIAKANNELWNTEVEKGCGYTIPWLNLDREIFDKYRDGIIEKLPEPYACIYPNSILGSLKGKRVLCLASGGGQQSAVFGILGADVTVVDISQGQLSGDRKAAEYYGYDIKVFLGDMRDLSMFEESAFDMVYQANSMAYIPNTSEVYSQVGKILKKGGIYRFVISQPAVQAVKWDGEKYYISEPYCEKEFRRTDGGIEFRHNMSDIFNELIKNGFELNSVYESPYSNIDLSVESPGDWNHERAYVAGEFCLISAKK